MLCSNVNRESNARISSSYHLRFLRDWSSKHFVFRKLGQVLVLTRRPLVVRIAIRTLPETHVRPKKAGKLAISGTFLRFRISLVFDEVRQDKCYITFLTRRTNTCPCKVSSSHGDYFRELPGEPHRAKLSCPSAYSESQRLEKKNKKSSRSPMYLYSNTTCFYFDACVRSTSRHFIASQGGCHLY